MHIKGLDNCFMRYDVAEVYLQENKYRLNYLKKVDIKSFG